MEMSLIHHMVYSLKKYTFNQFIVYLVLCKHHHNLRFELSYHLPKAASINITPLTPHGSSLLPPLVI